MFAVFLATFFFQLPTTRAVDIPAAVEIPSAGELTAPPRAAIGADGRIFVATATAEGLDVVASKDASCATFGAPVHAVHRSDIIAGGRRGPRIAILATTKPPTLVLAAITRRTKEPTGDTGGDLLAWRSTDAGATWTGPSLVGDVPGCAAEGLFDLAALGDGRFVAVWLDVREKGTRLRADFSKDGATWGEDVLAYESPTGSICECCHPAVIAARDGGAWLAFRNSIDNVRDIWTMHLPPSSRRFDTAQRSGTGSWKIAACPMAGPSIDEGEAGFFAAWRRETQLFFVPPHSSEQPVGTGSEPQILVRKGIHLFWIADGNLVHLPPGLYKPHLLAEHAAFPSAIQGKSALVFWTDTQTRHGKLIVLQQP